jgi:hypothetical protein
VLDSGDRRRPQRNGKPRGGRARASSRQEGARGVNTSWSGGEDVRAAPLRAAPRRVRAHGCHRDAVAPHRRMPVHVPASTKGRSRPPASSLRPGSSCLALSLWSSLPSASSTARCRVRRLPLRGAPVVGGNCIPPAGQHVVHVGLRQRRAVKFVLLCFATSSAM